MKKILFVATVVASLVGCANSIDRQQEQKSVSSTVDQGRQKIYNDRAELQQSYNGRAVMEAPNWMNKLPESKDAVYANGSATSTDMSMSADKAKLVAYGKICMAAGGSVDQRNTMFRTDTESSSVEKSELAIRGVCRKVDISGVEIAEVKTIAEGNRFRTFVLVALPIGDANTILKRKDQLRIQESAKVRSEQVFREMDEAAAVPATNQ